MDKKDLVITSGNKRFFEDLERFVLTLRREGQYGGRVVVCDNVISGTWDAPGTYLDEPGFDDAQNEFFASENVEVVRFSDLVERNGIARKDIERIEGRTQRYPYKFIYSCLLSKENLGRGGNVFYFDSDVLFQRPLSLIGLQMKPGQIYMTSEHDRVGDLPFMSEWIRTTDVSVGGDNAAFVQTMDDARNFCTGFIAGGAEIFNRLMQLCWALASSRTITFHTDQPLVNILHSYFGYPITELGKDMVLHLKGAPEGSLRMEGSTILYNGTAPVAVHFNGASRKVKVDPDGTLRFTPQRSLQGRLVDRAVRFLKGK